MGVACIIIRVSVFQRARKDGWAAAAIVIGRIFLSGDKRQGWSRAGALYIINILMPMSEVNEIL